MAELLNYFALSEKYEGGAGCWVCVYLSECACECNFNKFSDSIALYAIAILCFLFRDGDWQGLQSNINRPNCGLNI